MFNAHNQRLPEGIVIDVSTLLSSYRSKEAPTPEKFVGDLEAVMKGLGRDSARLDGHTVDTASSVPDAIQSRMDSAAEMARTKAVPRRDAESILASQDMEVRLAEIIRTEFAEMFSSRYIVSNADGIAAWADSYTQKVWTPSGRATFVMSADMPAVELIGTEVNRRIHTLGAKAAYSWFDMMRASFAGVSLDTEKARAAAESVAQSLDQVLLVGDSSLPAPNGLITTGLINDATVTATNVTGAVWTSKTEVQIRNDIQVAISAVRTAVGHKAGFLPDTILLPENQYNLLRQTTVGDTETSILNHIKNTFPEIKVIDVLPQLDAAGASSADRMLIYRNDPKVVRGVTPMAPQFIAPRQEVDLVLTVWAACRTAGTEWRRPFAGLYVDGI